MYQVIHLVRFDFKSRIRFGSVSCCDAKVDPISLLTAIGAIAAVSFFLRQAVMDNMIAPPRKKKRSIGVHGLEVQNPVSYGMDFYELDIKINELEQLFLIHFNSSKLKLLSV